MGSTTTRHYDELVRLGRALRLLEARAGVKRGEPFRATAAALQVESGLSPEALARARYIIERDGGAVFNAQGSRGTFVTLEPPQAAPEVA
jgi:hypothetical protein